MSKKYTFSLRWELEKVFTLLTENFSQLSGWFQNVKVPKVRLLVSAYLFVANIVMTLRVKRIKFTISKTLLYQNLPMTAYVKKIVISAVSSITSVVTQTVYVGKITVSAIGRLITKLPSVTLRVKKIYLVADPYVGSFPTLSFYDSDLLSSMDGEYLNTLEYIAS